MKNIYISHGDKGGVGKSFLATVIGSLFELSRCPFLIVEADANEKGGQPDVAPRFELSEYGQVITAPIGGVRSPEDLIADLFAIIEASDADHIVINAPAGASDVLEDVGELLGLACSNLNYRLVVFYSLFKTDVAIKQAEKFVKGDLAKYASEAYFVQNAFFGGFNVTNALLNVDCFRVDTLHSNVMEKIKDNMNFCDALLRLPIIQRIQLEKFFHDLSDQGFRNILKLSVQ